MTSIARHKIRNSFIAISNIFFLSLYVTLCLNNRLAIDDFHFLSNVNELGVIAGTIAEYNGWSSRWLSVLLNHFILYLNEKSNVALPAFGILSLTLFVLVVFFTLKNLSSLSSTSRISHFSKNGILSDNRSVINYSVFLVSILFVSTIKIDETWFWLCASTTYLWSNMMFILGAACLVYKKKSFAITLISCICFLYVGGSSGPLALICLLLLLILSILSFTKHFPLKENRELILRRAALCFFMCLFSFLVLYLAKGNRIREQFFEDISIGYGFILNIKMVGIILIKRLPHVLPAIILFCLPMISFGHNFWMGKAGQDWKYKLIYLFAGFIVLIYIFQLPITYKTQDVGAYRALFFVSILTIGLILTVFFLIGKNVSINKHFNTALITCPFIVSSFLFGYEFLNQRTITSKYAKAYDQRLHYLRMNSDSSFLELVPLPPSGMLFSAEISADTTHFSNQHLKKALHLTGNVRKQTIH